MTYYRRKILLALIQRFGGTLGATVLQKYLFLMTRLQKDKAYDFVPYKFGCYSFQANYDLGALEKKGFLKIVRNKNCINYIINPETDCLSLIKREDVGAINEIYNQYAQLNAHELIRKTYLKYPFFAINSTIIDSTLTEDEKIKVFSQKRNFSEKGLFTIGYEGISLELYMVKLILNGISILCDVRKNPYSQKFGFSRKQLSDACEGLGITYIHIPELGIVSDERQDLQTMSDYKKLFQKYKETTLVDNQEYLYKIKNLFNSNNRIALTCFEKEVAMCHRGVVAKALVELPGWDYPLKHL